MWMGVFSGAVEWRAVEVDMRILGDWRDEGVRVCGIVVGCGGGGGSFGELGWSSLALLEPPRWRRRGMVR